MKTMFLTCAEAGELTHTSPRLWRYKCERGEVRAVKLGRVWRIDKTSLLRLLGLSEGQVTE